MGPAIIALVVILYFVLAYFASRTWKVWHVVMLVGLFLLSFVFLILSAATLKVQKKYRERHNGIVAQLDQELANQQRLTYGKADELGVIQLRSAAKQVLIDRGRAWRNLQLTDFNVDEGRVTLNATKWGDAGCRVAGTDAAEDSGYSDDGDDDDSGGSDGSDATDSASGNAAKLDLEASAIVYAFTEAPLTKLSIEVQSALIGDSELLSRDTTGHCKVPFTYVGEFRVEGQPGADITLVATLPLSDELIAKLEQEAGLTWVLYESMPVDSHEAFAGLSAEQLEQIGMPTDLVAEYARDQQRALDTDPPERKWLRVRFTQAHSIRVDVKQYSEDDVEGAEITNAPMAAGFFDESGRSLLATLDQRGPTEFNEGDEVIFDWQTAQSLINDGKAEAVEPIYDRRLRDYARDFRAIRSAIEGLDRQIALAESDLKKLDDSLARLEEQLAFQTQQHADLKHDEDGINREVALLGPYLAAVEKKWAALRTELSRLYRANRQLANR